MNDRQFLQLLLKICIEGIHQADHIEDIRAEYEDMYTMIFEHLNPPEQGVAGQAAKPPDGGV